MEGSKSVLSRVKTASINFIVQFLASFKCWLLKSKDGFKSPQIGTVTRSTKRITTYGAGDESDRNDDNYCNEFIMSEKQYSSTSDENTSLDADTSVLFCR